MDTIIQMLLNYGTLGLSLAAFTESFISPIPPDILLVSLALAAPPKAIYYGLVATGASVAGGCLGYALGHRFGPPMLKRFVAPRYLERIHRLIEKYGAWAIFLGALAPIPYKFISITAGALRIPLPVFLAASLFGRAKRFLLEGILIYYYGPQALSFVQNFSAHTSSIVAMAIALALISVVYWKIRARKMAPSSD